MRKDKSETGVKFWYILLMDGVSVLIEGVAHAARPTSAVKGTVLVDVPVGSVHERPQVHQ